MISTTSYYKRITVIQVLAIIISVVKCDNPPSIDYDLQTITYDSNDYNGYHFRIHSRYNQSKLDPEKFFKSLYIRSYRVLPNPLIKDFEAYRQYYMESEKMINLEAMKDKAEVYEPDEESSEEIDDRYIKTNADIYAPTNEMYYQSNIYNKEHDIAEKYYNTLPKKKTSIAPEPLSLEEFNEIMAFYELMPKYYEDGDTFIKSRVEFGRLIGKSFKDLGIKGATDSKIKLPDNQYDTELVEIGLKDIHLKDEDYYHYSLRMVYLGKIPLHPDICNELYKTTHSIKPEYQYLGLKINLTKNPDLQNSKKPKADAEE